MVNTRALRTLTAFVVLFFCSTSLFAQTNLVTNGDFEQTTGFDYQTLSDYERIWSGTVGEGKFIHDYTSAGHGAGTFGGWPSNLTGYGGSGYYLLFNGFGTAINPTKAAWRQQVSVTSQTTYTFSFQVRNLSQSFMGINANPAIIRVKINGAAVGSDVTLSITNHNWQEVTRTWNSGNVTGNITIEILDVYTGEPGRGDDFGLDHISFTPNALYSVDAVDDWDVEACQNTAVDINVLANDIVTPNTNDATVTIVTQPTHGTASVLSDKRIRYTFAGGNYTTDQLKYRVANHGVTDEAWVHINTSRPPQVANITAPGPICAGGVLGIATPTVDPNMAGQWEKSTNPNGPYQAFDPNNIPLTMNGNYVRYSATNSCDTGSSNAVQITVTNGPSFSGQTPQFSPICAGGSLNLTPPTYSANGSQILSQGWVASPTENGTYTAFNLNNIPASCNGWFIRYMVEGSCGFVYSNPARQLTVNVAPEITGTLQVPPTICAGDDLEVVVPSYDGNGTGTWEICQTSNGTYQPFSPLNVPATYNNWYLHYKVSNNCGNDVSDAVQIHVNDAPTIATPATPTAICAGGSFNLTTPTIQNNGATITSQGWQIASTQGGTYNAFNNNNVQYSSNGYWIRYYAENDCGPTYSAAVQVTVNDIPVVGSIIAPAGICAGEAFNLTTPTVDWRHTNQGTGGWEIEINGTWQPLANSNIPYAYNGCIIRYKAENGCGTAYSTNTVQATVFSTDPVDEGEITACDVIYHHGVLCNHNGVYVADSVTPNGCTIQVSWNFTLGEAYIAPVEYQEACDSYYWAKTHRTYYQTNVYDTLIMSNDPQVCDSTFTLNLTINHAPSILSDLQAPSDVCAGNPLPVTAPQFQMNHNGGGQQRWEYATSANGPYHPFDPSTYPLEYGSYYLRFAVTNDCDSTFSNVVQFNVNGIPVIEGQLNAIQVCEGQTMDLPEVDVEWRNVNENDRVGEWQMANTESGTYAPINPNMTMQLSHNGCFIRYYAHTSCGTDILGPVLVTVLSAEDQWLETITACDSYTLPSGEVITTSQVVDYEVMEPCFHIVHQPVVINNSDYKVEAITWCQDDYEWHGRIFYRSEQTQYAWDTLVNQAGCDSIVELNLNFDDYSTFTHTRTACGSYVWEMKPDVTYTESTRDSLFVPAVGDEDCDTWYYLDLTLGHDTLVEGGYMTQCSGFVWHGVPYYEDAVVYDSLLTAGTRCDSIIAYQLHIIQPIERDTAIVSCQPIWWHGHYCEEAGDFVHTFQSEYGCDSIVTMHFSLQEALERQVDTLVCEPFEWHGHVFNENGQATHTFVSPQGCDSIVHLTVTFSETEIQPESLSACDTYEFQGVVYDEPGFYEIYHDTVFAPNGCVATVQLLNLTVNDSDHLGVISGSSSVYVASNIISGIYRYELDTTGVQGHIVWSLSNPDWHIVEEGDNYCRVFVGTAGSAILQAQFMTASCGYVVREFEINAGFFGVEEQVLEVNVFPNPTKGMVRIEAEAIESVRVIDMMGQVLGQWQCDRSSQFDLNLSGYEPSVYLLEVKTELGLAKKRVTVCR